MDHQKAEELAAEIAYMQDDPSFRPKQRKPVKEIIKIDDYVRFHVFDKKNGHDIVITYGDEKNLKHCQTLTLQCRWYRNKNPRTKPFTLNEK